MERGRREGKQPVIDDDEDHHQKDDVEDHHQKDDDEMKMDEEMKGRKNHEAAGCSNHHPKSSTDSELHWNGYFDFIDSTDKPSGPPPETKREIVDDLGEDELFYDAQSLIMDTHQDDKTKTHPPVVPVSINSPPPFVAQAQPQAQQLVPQPSDHFIQQNPPFEPRFAPPFQPRPYYRDHHHHQPFFGIQPVHPPMVFNNVHDIHYRGNFFLGYDNQFGTNGVPLHPPMVFDNVYDDHHFRGNFFLGYDNQFGTNGVPLHPPMVFDNVYDYHYRGNIYHHHHQMIVNNRGGANLGHHHLEPVPDSGMWIIGDSNYRRPIFFNSHQIGMGVFYTDQQRGTGVFLLPRQAADQRAPPQQAYVYNIGRGGAGTGSGRGDYHHQVRRPLGRAAAPNTNFNARNHDLQRGPRTG